MSKKNAPPASSPGMTEGDYQKVVAGYPDLKETEKSGYQKLCALCVGPDNRDKVMQFIGSLKDYTDDVDRRTTLNVVMEFLDDNDIHFIMGLDWRTGIEDLDWRIRGALKQNFDLEIDLPELTKYPSNASVNFDPVFSDFDAPLRKHGLQIGFINEGSDSYIILVHWISDKNEIVQSVEQIGYFYYDSIDNDEDIAKRAAVVAPPTLPTRTPPKQNFWYIYLGIVLLCPVFSYAAYRGYLKDGLSLTVILVGSLNLLFYWFGINGLISSWKSKKK